MSHEGGMGDNAQRTGVGAAAVVTLRKGESMAAARILLLMALVLGLAAVLGGWTWDPSAALL
jgi:hypothetical protein